MFHSPICKKELTKRCYDRLHWAWCEVPLENGELCGERFQVHSPGGCMKVGHEYHNSDENNRLRNLRRELDGGGLRKKTPDAEETTDKEEPAPVPVARERKRPERLRTWFTSWDKTEHREERAPPAPKSTADRKPKKAETKNTYGSWVKGKKNKKKGKKDEAN